jgi:hypothetical protein
MPAQSSPAGAATSLVEVASVAGAVSDGLGGRESVVVEPVPASSDLLEAAEAQAEMQNASTGNSQRMDTGYSTSED